MKIAPLFRRSMLLWIIVFTLSLFILIILTIYFGGLSLVRDLIGLFDSGTDAANSTAVQVRMAFLINRFIWFGIPACFLAATIWGLGLWFVLVHSTTRRISSLIGDLSANAKKPRSMEQPVVKSVEEKSVYKTDTQKERRRYVHLLSAFQREGRYIDFLFENIEAYADDQIGAAVRDIHENCRRVMSRHLTLGPITDVDEGENIILQRGFDIDSFSLVGNVKGDPPFEGIVRHRGWRVKGWDLPDFSKGVDSGIIQPAEIELI